MFPVFLDYSHPSGCEAVSHCDLDLRFVFLVFLVFVFCLFRVVPATYGGSQARGQIGAAAAGLHQSHSNTRSELCLRLHHSLWQRPILNPLSEARDRTRNLMVPSWIHFCCATVGTPKRLNLKCSH